MRKTLIALLLLLLFLFFLPKIASTSLGKALFTKAIEAKTKSRIEIGSLNLSWFGPQKFQNLHWTHQEAQGSFEELALYAPFWSFKGPFSLKNGEASYQNQSIKQIEAEVKGSQFALTAQGPQGPLSLTGSYFSSDHFSISGNIRGFPIAFLNPAFIPFAGSTLAIQGTAQMQTGKGTIDLAIQSENLSTRFKASIENQVLHLQEALSARIRLSSSLTHLFTQDSWVNLQIDPSGFAIPLPFSLKTLQVSKAVLDLGKITCQSTPPLVLILTLLKKGQLIDRNQMQIWFTPVQLSLSEAILSLNRIDALAANLIHLCAWGQIDLQTESLDMTIGIPADTLAKTLDIQNLPSSYVLTVPVQGTLQNPAISQKTALAKIAALLAKEQIPNKNGVKGLIDLFAKSKEDKSVPPPQYPFPWQ